MNNDLHQWYIDIDGKLEEVDKYENLIEKYYKNLRFHVDRRLIKPYLTGFYKKDSFVKYLKNIVPLSMFIGVGGGVLCFLISFLYQFFSYNPIKEAIHHVGSFLKLSGLAFVIAFCVVTGAVILFKFINYCLITKKMEKLEKSLEPIMISLPAFYRSYNKMLLISQTYFAVKGVLPEQAFKACDENLDVLDPRPVPGIMFDLPFKNNLITDTTYTAGESVAETSNYEYDNEFLPSDIKQRTFEGSEDAEKDLQNMVGLESVKQQIEKLKNRIQFYGTTNAGTGGNHMAFYGGAGSGKTSMARVVSKILFDLGYIKKNQVVEISGDYLRSGSSSRALAIIEYSYGGVLFIDEAYLLYDKDGRGNEAIGILLKAMEDHRNDFVVILAGYEEQMTRLIASNEGFSSRIKHNIYFPDYTVEEMYDIFRLFIDNYNGKHYVIAEEAVPLLLDTFELEKKSSSFGNARTVRNAVDIIMDYYVDRSIQSGTDTGEITLADVGKYNADRKRIIQHELKNSSAVKQVDESIIRLSELKSKVVDGSENPLEDLQSLVGLESLKKELQLLKNQRDFYQELKPQKILLLGDCGKSTIASILTGYMYQLGYIQENSLLSVSADFFKGSYVGHTTKRAEAIISYASGGVLFIKNINRLVNSNDNFDQEVLGVINDALKENENVTIIIGDTDSAYLRGMSEKFDIIYTIPTYNKEQLCQIFCKQAENDGFSVTQDAVAKLNSMISNNTNIKVMLNYYNNAKKKHMSDFTEKTKYVLTADDIEMPSIRISLHK